MSARARPRASATPAAASWSPRSIRSARCRRRWRATRSTTMDDAAPRADIFVTATGNVDVITIDHMRAMKHRAIVCNIGHFDSEIQVARAARTTSGTTSSRRSTRSSSPTASASSFCREGRLVNLGNATGHPSFVMSASFTNQTLAQIELFTKPGEVREARSTRCRRSSTRRSPRSISPRSASS